MRTLPILFAVVLVFFINFKHSYGDNVSKEPTIVIIGAGPSGIAAAAKLIENGFKNVTILEAEDRIGGRVYTTKLGEYNVDLGGQWVAGEGENVVFKLAYPLGLLDNNNNYYPSDKSQFPYVDSQGKFLEGNIHKNLTDFYKKYILSTEFRSASSYKTVGEYVEKKYDAIFSGYPEFMKEKKKYLHLFQLLVIRCDSAPDWYDLPAQLNNEFQYYEGNFAINWKTRGYSTILDILMKRYPDPQKELPVLEKTLLNTEVISINYLNNTQVQPILITTSKGQLFKADHVIVTVSLGVLKEKHKSLFIPPLPEKKVQAIEGLGFGNIAKLYVLFDKPFWDLGDKRELSLNFIWNDDDKETVISDREKVWTLGITYLITLRHKPNLFEMWIIGPYAKEMEKLSEHKVFGHTVEFLKRFLGKTYNVTVPLGILRTRWYSNPHFRGTYSYTSIEAAKRNIKPEMLEEPINLDNLTLLFAGEATHAKRFSTVDGAVESGWKAADRLIEHYKNTNNRSV